MSNAHPIIAAGADAVAEQQAMSSSKQPRFAILLATLNGEDFLGEQLSSYERQSDQDWALFISDDGSSDDTLKVIEAFATGRRQRVSTRSGPGAGHCRNFMSLVRDPTIRAEYYAYSDQDDIWYPDKLRRAALWLSKRDPVRPALYCARTKLVDARGNPFGLSPALSGSPSFRNALVQNIASGNTMVFNDAAKRLMESAPYSGVLHDWWTYQVVAGAGGDVHFDADPAVKYRQHTRAAIGANVGLVSRIRRLVMTLRGEAASWNECNVKALLAIESDLDPLNQRTLRHFAAARTARLPQRMFLLKRSGAHKQTLLQNLNFIFAAILGKI